MELGLFPGDVLDNILSYLPLKYLNYFRRTNKRIFILCNNAFYRIILKIYPGHWEFIHNKGLINNHCTTEYYYISIKQYYSIKNSSFLHELVKQDNYIGIELYYFHNKNPICSRSFISEIQKRRRKYIHN